MEKTRRAAHEKIGTGPLNRLLHAAVELQPPPTRANKRFKLLYATQVADKSGSPIPAPTFLLFVNDPGLLVDSYHKYLENKLRETFPFPGLPITLKQRGRESKPEARPAALAASAKAAGGKTRSRAPLGSRQQKTKGARRK